MRPVKNIFSGKQVNEMEEQILSGKEFSFGRFAWKQFRKNKISFWAFRFFMFLIIVALLAPVLANDRPIYCRYKNNTFFPVFTTKINYEIKDDRGNTIETIDIENFEWIHKDFESVLWPLISVYAPGKSDKDNYGDNIGPFSKQSFTNSKGELVDMPVRFRHWLGVTKDGGDVATGIINGIKFSLFIGIFSYLISSLLGIFLGSAAGYFGNTTIKTTWAGAIIFCIGLALAWFYGFTVRSGPLSDSFSQSGLTTLFQLLLSFSIAAAIIFIFYRLGKAAGKIKILSKKINVPVDAIISRGIEILNAMPLFLLIISLSVIAKPSYFTLIMIIGFTGWTGIARLTRAEFLRIRSLDYITAGKSFGFTHARIIFRHALPNALAPSLVAIAFGIASCILAESSLSFLGVGVPPDVITWGKLISAARESISSWWLVVFPGIAIFMTVLMYNLIGEGLRDALDPKLKQ